MPNVAVFLGSLVVVVIVEVVAHGMELAISSRFCIVHPLPQCFVRVVHVIAQNERKGEEEAYRRAYKHTDRQAVVVFLAKEWKNAS